MTYASFSLYKKRSFSVHFLTVIPPFCYSQAKNSTMCFPFTRALNAFRRVLKGLPSTNGGYGTSSPSLPLLVTMYSRAGMPRSTAHRPCFGYRFRSLVLLMNTSTYFTSGVRGGCTIRSIIPYRDAGVTCSSIDNPAHVADISVRRKAFRRIFTHIQVEKCAQVLVDHTQSITRLEIRRHQNG